MSQRSTVDTSTALLDREPHSEPVEFRRLLATVLLGLRLAAASTNGVRRCFWEQSSATQIAAGAYAESSTQIREMTPEIKVRLDAILDAARRDIIEDGMYNAINERLPGLIARDFKAVIPALMSVIEGGRTTPIIAAEVLKELGRLRNDASHASRLWVLERALNQPSPYIRDGAGLGLAALGDPNAIPYLRRAVENDPNAQTRADLQLVIDELSEKMRDGAPSASHH
jgi:hypothetical protein